MPVSSPAFVVLYYKYTHMYRKLLASVAFTILCIQTLFAGEAKISGKITNPLDEEVKFSYYANYLDYAPKEFAAKLSADGSFSITIPVTEKYTQLSVQNGEQASEFFIQPGDELVMTVDAQNFDSTLRYAGKGAPIANLMAKHMLQSGMMMQFARVLQPHYRKETAEFTALAKVEMQKEVDFVEKNKKGLPEDFIKYWKAWYQYSIYSDMLRFSFMHAVMKAGNMNVKLTKEDYRIALDVPVAFNDEYMSIPTYVQYAGDIYNYQYSAKVEADTTIPAEIRAAKQREVVNAQAKATMPAKTKEFFFAQQVFSNVKGNTLEEVEKMYASFRKDYKTSAYDTIVDRVVNLKRKMAKGQPALDFAFTTLEGEKMKLSDLKGKVVYLDFWASWCGPCMRELPFAKKLKEAFHDKDVVFLNVSIDEDMGAWKNAIQKHSIGGIHTCEPGGWQAPAAKLYGVQGVPSYYLIDKNGNFATENSPRPSETEELTKQIEALLN